MLVALLNCNRVAHCKVQRDASVVAELVVRDKRMREDSQDMLVVVVVGGNVTVGEGWACRHWGGDSVGVVEGHSYRDMGVALTAEELMCGDYLVVDN